MILCNATIKYKGYDPYTLSKGSHKRVCVSCDQCGRVRWLPYKNYMRYDLKNNKNMDKINKLALNYLRGDI